MAENRRGLGRGLSALMEETDAPVADVPVVGGATSRAPIELIRRNPDQPRRFFAEAEIDELADSIREKGVLQPILVRPAPTAPGEYQIVAGERRWRAAQKAGLREIPILVRELNDAETLEIAILENVQREDLNAMEEAEGYRTLINTYDRTQDMVAKVVGKSRSHIANAIRLLSLPASIQALVSEGKLSAGHARALVGAADPEGLARRAIEQGLNVRDTEALARKAAGRAEPSTKAGKPGRPVGGKDADTVELEQSLSDALGLTVEIVHSEAGGSVRVDYLTLEQLDEVCRRLMRG